MGYPRILLVDDHRMFRQGLREIIENKTPFEVVGEASTGREVQMLVNTFKPDMILLDFQLPDMTGVEVAQQIAQSYPHIKIIMLTMCRDEQRFIDSIQAGVRAYLLKDADVEELVSVIGRVHRGETAIDPALTAHVLCALRQPRVEEATTLLTEREQEILQLLVAGYNNRTISIHLNLTEKTVGNRLSEIFQKLGVTNRTQAALVAIQRGLIPPASDPAERSA